MAKCRNCNTWTGAPEWKARQHTIWSNASGNKVRVFCYVCGQWTDITTLFDRTSADVVSEKVTIVLPPYKDWQPKTDLPENQYKPDSVSHPGETLLETLEQLGISLVDLATESGIDLEVINQIVTGEGSITPEIAQGLEDSLGVPYSFWRNRQVNYDIAKNQRIR